MIASHVFYGPLDPTWRAKAACRGMSTDLFFTELPYDTRLAKAICETCPVREDCLEEALANGEQEGLWGGLTTKERTRERRRRAKASLPERRALA